jgi:general secretion pathway protein I
LFRVMHSRWRRQAGFTIIEALVALAVVAALLAAAGTLIASSVRAASKIDRHVELVQTARAIASVLPKRERLIGNLSGELGGGRWRVDVLPFAIGDTNPESPWVPQTIVITVRLPTGEPFGLSTVRLRERGKV